MATRDMAANSSSGFPSCAELSDAVSLFSKGNSLFYSILFAVFEQIWSRDTLLWANSLHWKRWGRVLYDPGLDWILNDFPERVQSAKPHRAGGSVSRTWLWPFLLRVHKPKKTTLRVSLLIHCLQSGWRLYNVYSDKQWRRSNSGPWVEVLRAGFSKKLFSKWRKLVEKLKIN